MAPSLIPLSAETMVLKTNWT